MKLLIGIPAYNEAGAIGNVLELLPRRIEGISKIDTLVVDDGSTDGTVDCIKGRNIYVIRHLTNRGLGGALKTILHFARDYGYDFLVTFDADGQHEGRDIQNLVNCMKENRADVVIGSRWKRKTNAPFSRRVVNAAANMATTFFYGIRTTDSQSGLRLFSKKAIGKIDLKSDRMEVSSEIFGEIARHRLKFTEMPISGIYTRYSLSKGQKLSNSFDVVFKLIMKFFQ